MFHHCTPKTLSQQLNKRRNRGYAPPSTLSAAPVGRNTSKNHRVRLPDTDTTARLPASTNFSGPPSVVGNLGEDAGNQARDQLARIRDPSFEASSPTGRSRCATSTSVNSVLPSHASPNSSSSRPWSTEQSSKGRIRTEEEHEIARQRARGKEKADEDLDDINNHAVCYLCIGKLDATNRHTCRDQDCSLTICTRCIHNACSLLPEHTFRPAENAIPGATAAPSQPVSIRSDSCRPTTPPAQSLCGCCEKSLDVRYFCKVCNFHLCRDCPEIHPEEHTLQGIQTNRPTSSGQSFGYVLGEISESEVVLDDHFDLNESDSDGLTHSEKPRQRRVKGKYQRRQLSQLSARPCPTPIMQENFPEQSLLAELLEQPGAEVTVNRKDLARVLRHIEDLRQSRESKARVNDAEQDNDAPPSIMRSGKAGSDISMCSSTSHDDVDSNDEKPASDRGQHARRRGRQRDLLNFNIPRPKPKRRGRWTLKERERLWELKGRGLQNVDIAKQLNRSCATVSRLVEEQN